MCTCQDLYLLRGQRYSRWRPAAILNNSFINKIFIFHETEMKFGKTSQFRSWMTQFLQISLTTSRNKIFKMASDNHNLLSYFS